MGILRRYRIFVYDPEVDGGVFKAIAGLLADSQRDALERLQRSTSRKIEIVESNGLVAGNSEGLQFIAREECRPETWPSVDTGRLPHSENSAKIRDAARGVLW